jgi:hypothetical protein
LVWGWRRWGVCGRSVRESDVLDQQPGAQVRELLDMPQAQVTFDRALDDDPLAREEVVQARGVQPEMFTQAPLDGGGIESVQDLAMEDQLGKGKSHDSLLRGCQHDLRYRRLRGASEQLTDPITCVLRSSSACGPPAAASMLAPSPTARVSLP